MKHIKQNAALLYNSLMQRYVTVKAGAGCGNSAADNDMDPVTINLYPAGQGKNTTQQSRSSTHENCPLQAELYGPVKPIQFTAFSPTLQAPQTVLIYKASNQTLTVR